MVTGKAGRDFTNQNWTDTFVERSDIGISTHTYAIAGSNTISTLDAIPSQAYLAGLQRQNHELWTSAPTQAEVDVYVNSLEHQFAAKQQGLRQIDNTRRAESIKRLRLSTLWWLVVAAIIGCIYWALRS